MLKLASIVVACATVLTGCGSQGKFHEVDQSPRELASASPDDRMLVRTASMSIEVAETTVASTRATEILKDAGGFVQESTSDEDRRVSIVARVPEAQLDAVLGRLAELGDVTRRTLTATDVTDEVVDLDARLKNLVTTRDTYRQLLEKAASVQDAVAVERELSRVQGDIDAMEAHRESLRSQVAMSEVRLELEKQTRLGPLGYLGQGIWWLVSNLFVFSP